MSQPEISAGGAAAGFNPDADGSGGTNYNRQYGAADVIREEETMNIEELIAIINTESIQSFIPLRDISDEKTRLEYQARMGDRKSVV